MPNRVTARKVRAKELSPALRRRFHLVPEEEVSVTVTKRSIRKAPRHKDPWIDIRGSLSPKEADEMVCAINLSRRSKGDAPKLDAL
jgi:hypothetical protein